VLVEFPKSPNAIFVLPQGNLPGQEETATAWRVKLDIKAGETYRLTAYADTSDTSVETLLPKDGDLDNSVLVSVLAEPTLDAVTRAKLQNLADLRAAEGSRSEALQKLTDERDAMNNDEQRLRANIQAVFNPGDLRDKLLAELAGDESELARLAEAIHSAQANVAQAHAALQAAEVSRAPESLHAGDFAFGVEAEDVYDVDFGAARGAYLDQEAEGGGVGGDADRAGQFEAHAHVHGFFVEIGDRRAAGQDFAADRVLERCVLRIKAHHRGGIAGGERFDIGVDGRSLRIDL
jgi:hypothetical protein